MEISKERLLIFSPKSESKKWLKVVESWLMLVLAIIFLLQQV